MPRTRLGITAVLLAAVLLVATSLIAPVSSADAQVVEPPAGVLPAAGPDCATDEPGFVTRGEGTWTEFGGRPVATCTFDDAALPPIFPRHQVVMRVLYRPATETATAWQGFLDDESFDLQLGNPVDLVADQDGLTFFAGLIGQITWCPGAGGGPLSDCKWTGNGVALTSDCSVVGISPVVQGVDAAHLAIAELPPDFDWAALRRVAADLTEANAGYVDAVHRPECARTCEVSGASTDHLGVAISQARLEVTHGSTVLGSGATRADGTYTVGFACERSATFDPNTDRPHLDLILSSSDQHYDVYGGPTGAVIARFRSDGIPIVANVDNYSRDFRFGRIPGNYVEVAGNVPKAQWYEWVEIYQNISAALDLADLLGEKLDYALPLDVVANCTRPACRGQGANFAFMTENGGDPYIGLGTSTSRITDTGRPDNREYHEFGHFVQADLWDNELPQGGAGTTNHGGLANSDSTQGFIEGFAEWYSMMTQKHILGDADGHLYDMRGGAIDFEVDIDVWDRLHGKNAEEFAIAGMLLDLEDGPADYATDPSRPNVVVGNVASVPTESRRIQPYEVTVRNDGRAMTDPLVVTMVLLDGGVDRWTIPAYPRPRRLAPGQSVDVLIPVPTGLPEQWDDFRIDVTENVMARSGRDDDGIDLRLDEVWEAIRDYRAANVRTHFVTDLYAAFSALMTTPEETESLDQIFIAHGLFSDADGRHVYDRGTDIIGRTDTPTHSPRFAPERDVPGAELHLRGLPAGSAVDLIILPAAPVEHLARVERVDVAADGVVVLVGPPAAVGGHVVVVGHRADGSGFVIADYTADELAAQAERGIPREIDVTEQFGEPIDPGGGGPGGTGYRMLEADGTVHVFGSATHLGDPASQFGAGERAVAMAVTPSGGGYSILTNANIVYGYGNAPPLGASERVSLLANERLSTISISPSGTGTWIFTNRGRVLTFGDAGHFGDLLALELQGEIIASVVTPSGQGYYLIGSDGGVFAFGDAAFHGSIQGIVNELVAPGFPANQWLACPIVGLVPTPDGRGYWLVACDGGVFSFGAAPYRGSVPDAIPGAPLNRPINGMVAYGGGYLMVASDGGAFNFGAPFFGSLGAAPPADPIIAITPYSG